MPPKRRRSKDNNSKPRSKYKRSCPCCHKEISNIGTHLDKSNDCKQFYFKNNIVCPPVSNDSSKTNYNNTNQSSRSNHNNVLAQNISHKSNSKEETTLIPSATSIIVGNIHPIDEMSFQTEFNTTSTNQINDSTEIVEQNNNGSKEIQLNNSMELRNYEKLSMNIHNHFQETTLNVPTLISMKLFKILNKPNIPLYLYDEVNEFMKHSMPILNKTRMNCFFTRTQLLEQLYRIIMHGAIIPMTERTKSNKYYFDLFPRNHQMHLSHSSLNINVARFDMKSMIVSLLMDPLLMQEKNLLMFKKEYQQPHHSHHNDTFGDIHTGYWFKNAHTHLCKNTNDILCPIIMFIDGVGLDAMQRQSLEPVTFTLGIFNRNARNSELFWRLIGYIPNPEKHCNIKYDLLPNNLNSDKVKKDHYQEMLSFILADLKQIQDEGGIRWKFKCGTTFNLKFPIMYIIGDAVGLDKLCNRNQNYSPRKNFMIGCCRDCNSVFEHCHKPEHQCQYHKQSYFSKMSTKLKQVLSFHSTTTNAFSQLCFGNSNSNAVDSSPPEPLHQWYLGVVKTTLEFFWDRLTRPAIKYIDIIVKGICTESHRQSDRNMPNIVNFCNGLMKDKTTGMEKENQLFVLYLALLPTMVRDKIIEIDKKSIARSKVKKDDTIIYDKLLDTSNKFDRWLRLFETMLSISSWLKQTEVPKSDVENSINVTLKKDTSIFDPDIIKHFQDDDKEIDVKDVEDFNKGIKDVEVTISKFNNSIRHFMKDLQDAFGPNNQIKLQTMKNHQSLHYDYYIKRFGCVPNFDGGCNEQNMKSQVTQPSAKTQHRSSSLAFQTATRYAENLIIDLGHNIAHHKHQFSTSLFQTANDYFQKSSEHNFYMVTNDNNNEDSVSTDTIACMYARKFHIFTYEEEYESDSNGDRELYIRSFRLYKNKEKQSVREILEEKSTFYKKSLITNVFQLLIGKGLFPASNSKRNQLQCFQTLKIGDYLFRSSTNFYGKEGGEWIDWVNVKWTIDDTNDLILPSRLILLIDVEKTEILNDYKISPEKRPHCPLGNYWAIVKSAKRENTSITNNTRLATYYEMEEDIHLISCMNIVDPVFVINNRDYDRDDDIINRTEELSSIIAISPTDSWHTLFLTDVAFSVS